MTARGITGVVLAGGASTRFASPDGRSKLDADLAGRTVLDRTIDAAAVSSDEVLVVGREHGTRAGVVQYIPDPAAFEGPLAGLLTGLAAAAQPVVVAIAGDSSFTRPEVLAILADSLVDQSIAVAVLADANHWRPLPLALRVATARPIVDAAFSRGERSIRRALGGLRLAIVPEATWRLADPDGDTLFDIDSPADLTAAVVRLSR